MSLPKLIRWAAASFPGYWPYLRAPGKPPGAKLATADELLVAYNTLVPLNVPSACRFLLLATSLP